MKVRSVLVLLLVAAVVVGGAAVVADERVSPDADVESAAGHDDTAAEQAASANGASGTSVDGDPSFDQQEAPDYEVRMQQAEGGQMPPAARGSPHLRVHLPDDTVSPGATNQLGIQISNDGRVTWGSPELADTVTTARNVRVEADADDPLTVETEQQSIGSVTRNQPGEAPIAVSVPDDVEPGTYTIDLVVRYSYTSQISSSGVTQDRSTRLRTSVDVEVTEDARFEIVDVTTDAQVGDTGTLEAEIENVGADTARDLNVALESSSSGFTFGETMQDSARIAELEPGERATVTYDVAVGPDAVVREYTLDGTVQFRTPEGLQRVDERPVVGVTPDAKQRFAIDDVESTLRVGEDGDLRGTVTNRGPNEAQNVVVRYTEESPNLIPIERTVAVGTLDAGESESFRLPVEVSGEAEAVPRAVDVAVQYRNAEFEQRLYDDLEITADVAPKRDQFVVEVQDRQITAGDTVAFDVEVTNNLDQTASDVEARLFASSPLDSDDDEAFVEELAPGESTTMTFELEAEPGATAKTYPISFDFRYDDERGTSQLSDTTRVAITVVESDEEFPWSIVVGAVLVVVVAAGAYYYFREG